MSTTTERRNIEAVRRLYDAFARRDMTAAADTMAANIQWHESVELPWGGTHTSPPAVHQRASSPIRSSAGSSSSSTTRLGSR